jgi:hypothetical protein
VIHNLKSHTLKLAGRRHLLALFLKHSYCGFSSKLSINLALVKWMIVSTHHVHRNWIRFFEINWLNLSLSRSLACSFRMWKDLTYIHFHSRKKWIDEAFTRRYLHRTFCKYFKIHFIPPLRFMSIDFHSLSFTLLTRSCTLLSSLKRFFRNNSNFTRNLMC